MKSLFFVLALCCVTSLAYAQTHNTPATPTQATAEQSLHPALYVESIQAKQQNEKHGDEIYFAIAVYSKDKNSFYTVPEQPISTPAKALEKINNVKLWDGELAVGDSIELVVTLVEHDHPPWNTDDTIGVAKIQITNQGGVLKSKWEAPSKNSEQRVVPASAGEIHSFVFTGNRSAYEVDYQLKNIQKQ